MADATQDAARLGQDLTCVGAEKAGNADGSIPPFSGKWQGVPPHVDFKGTGYHPVDPYAGEEPLFIITAQNMNEHADYLTDGMKALFKLYPQTFQMPIYPSHRDFRLRDSICEATRANVGYAKIVDDGKGVVAKTGGTAFPMPTTGIELLKNASLFTLRSWTEEYVSDNAYVLKDGKVNWGRVKSRNLAPHLKPGYVGDTVGNSAYYLNETLLPQRDKGEVNTGTEFWNDKTDPRQSWRYDPGTRRVRQSPGYGFDMAFPGTGGTITVDEVRLFNGSGERYDWTIVGKQELYIPYNAYGIHSPELKYEDMLTPGHINPKVMRYEKHRVWVLEGTLKEGNRHLYGKRRMYIDEDTWFPIVGDNYDNRGELWRTSMINYYYAYEMQSPQAGVGLYHDLNAGTYLAFNLINEQEKGYILNEGKFTPRDFGPEAARRLGR
uniref:DUF1329 domain-containing protein n=1 Tax=Pseudomonas sp. TTU2014-080ASC TaxID=1729724 RepID=UPI001F4D0308|nr:DUF1329 domain-containing protein [Pseudomonas sp. TTU2014-080ASC]